MTSYCIAYINSHIANFITVFSSTYEDSKRSLPSPFLNAPRRNIPQRSQDRKRFFNVRTADVVPEQFKSKIRFNLTAIPIPKPVEIVAESSDEEHFVQEEVVDGALVTLDEEIPKQRLIDRAKVFGSLTQGLEVEIPFRRIHQKDFLYR